MAADGEVERNRVEEVARMEEATKRQLVELNLIEQQEAEAQLETSCCPLAKVLANKKATQPSIGSDEEEFPWSVVEDSESEVEIIQKVGN
jgi:hypothetical protein